ncbi:MAG: peptide ABC transporter substrate-binding protein [Nibricoccus sp.]
MLLRSAFYSLLLAIACVSFGCKKSSAPESRPSTNTTQYKVLHAGNGSEPKDIDPQVVMGSVEYGLIRALFEGLVTSDPITQLPRPGVAERWEISPDGLVYTFFLRADAKWSNGEVITASDFVRSYQRILNPKLGAEYAYNLFHLVGAEDYQTGKLTDFSKVGCKALDDRTLQLTLRQPAPFLLQLLAYYPWDAVPISVIEKFGGLERRGSAWTRPENFVGNGPFVLVDWKPNQYIVVKRSPTYWDRANVQLDEIRFYPIESTDTEERMFRTGQLHITFEVPQSKIPVYLKERPDSIRRDPLDGVYFYRFNVKAPPFDNPKVRRALTLAIDRESLTTNVLHGGEQPAYSIVPPGNAGYVSRHHTTADVAEARRLLAEAGYPEGKGFPNVELVYNTLEKHRAIGEAVQQMWRKNLGIEISLRNEEWKVYLDNQHTKNYKIQRAGWVADYADPHVFLDLWETSAGNNDTNWSNAEYDALLREALNTKTTADRYEVYQKMEKILLDELPILPVYFYTQPRLVSPKVKGYYVTPLDNYPWKDVRLED